MAAFDAIRPNIDASRLFGGFGHALADVYSLLSGWNDRRVTRKALLALSDHELDDIGLSRGDVDAL